MIRQARTISAADLYELQTQDRWRHRADYAAYFFRWGFVKRFVRAELTVLDVECGRASPLATILKQTLARVPRRYVGTFAGRSGRGLPSYPWASYVPKLDFSNAKAVAKFRKTNGPFDVVVCLDELDRLVTKASRQRLLTNLGSVVAPGGVLLLSTAADPDAREEIERAGLFAEDCFGTYLRPESLRDEVTAAHASLVKQLTGYYDDDVARVLLAPLYPEASVEHVWVLRNESIPDETPTSTPKIPKSKRVKKE